MKKEVKDILSKTSLYDESFTLPYYYWYKYFAKEAESNLEINIDNFNIDGNDFVVEQDSIYALNDNNYCIMKIYKQDKEYNMNNFEIYMYGSRCVVIDTNLSVNANKTNVNSKISIYDKEAVDCFYRENFDGKIKEINDYFDTDFICPEDEFEFNVSKLHEDENIVYSFKNMYKTCSWKENCEVGYSDILNFAREMVYSFVLERTGGVIGKANVLKQ